MRAEFQAIQNDYAQLMKQYTRYREDLTEFSVLRLGGDSHAEIVLDLTDFKQFDGALVEEKRAAKQVPIFEWGRGHLSDALDIPPLTPAYPGGSI